MYVYINTTVKEYTSGIYIRYESCLLQIYEADKNGFISNKIQKYLSTLGCILILSYPHTCTLFLPHNVSDFCELLLAY